MTIGEKKIYETNPERCPAKSNLRVVAGFELVIPPNGVFVDRTPIV